MKREITLGMALHSVSNLLDRRMNAFITASDAEGITPAHGKILGFIRRSSELDHEVYQKDIETQFDIARSTVTATLKLMEKKGYIRREDVAHDARLKRIALTSLGAEALIRVETCIRQSEALMRGALTEQEHHELLRLLDCVKSALY